MVCCSVAQGVLWEVGACFYGNNRLKSIYEVCFYKLNSTYPNVIVRSPFKDVLFASTYYPGAVMNYVLPFNRNLFSSEENKRVGARKRYTA